MNINYYHNKNKLIIYDIFLLQDYSSLKTNQKIIDFEILELFIYSNNIDTIYFIDLFSPLINIKDNIYKYNLISLIDFNQFYNLNIELNYIKYQKININNNYNKIITEFTTNLDTSKFNKIDIIYQININDSKITNLKYRIK